MHRRSITLARLAVCTLAATEFACGRALAQAVDALKSDAKPPSATTRLDETVVIGVDGASELGATSAANQGRVDAARIEARVESRPGDVLENVPGLIVTQHSGAGKANQYFLRGFNLDHGTDFATFVDGVPINLPSHGHGQGYTDLNFLIPELVEAIEFRKGPYFADVGDFGSAGSARIDYATELDRGIARVEGGSFGHLRTLVADSARTSSGTWLYAVDLSHDDGPWVHPDSYDKASGIVRLTRGTESSGSTTSFEAYSGEWNSTDQIPKRAVDAGSLGRFDSIDPSDGGRAQRVALSNEWHSTTANGTSSLTAYGVYSNLELFSDFTYFLDDPVHGDQFEQTDRRFTTGLDARRTLDGELFGCANETLFGAQLRGDFVRNGLFHTQDRSVLSATRRDSIAESSAALFAQATTRWSKWFKSVAGLRGDVFRFDDRSSESVNSGAETDAIASPKLALVFGPFAKTEFFVDGGLGFHSNDARGVFLHDDPTTGAPNDGTPVDPLVRTRGAEIGLRTEALEHLESTLSLWVLDSDSEIVFAGDAGTTEASRPSRRTGVEWSNDFELAQSWSLDVDASFSHAEFTDRDPLGDHVPGAIESTVSAGVFYQAPKGWFGSLQLRYFGPRPLIEDDSVRSSESTLVNASVGYRIDDTWSVDVALLNLFNAKVNDIEYYYASELQGESGPTNDVHFHPAAPFALRVGLTARF